ncbi:hypothetical protein GS620_06220 [Ruegeria sp. HKCCD6428]|nr:hypothetical protein [Ruegeria sp. HKCCD6428]
MTGPSLDVAPKASPQRFERSDDRLAPTPKTINQPRAFLEQFIHPVAGYGPMSVAGKKFFMDVGSNILYS